METETQSLQDLLQNDGLLLIQETKVLDRAIYQAESQTLLLQKHVMNLLDEVGDILHDDHIIKKKIIRKFLVKPIFRKMIARELLIVIKSR
ncbi:MAG: hypothetical protein IIA45_11910 [Bacteroidetes bacterium]|nr:hypothetical protein [Bacteroidota bacterium]